MRETILWILVATLLAVGGFQAGWIFRDWRHDDTRERLFTLEERQRDVSGRLVVLEGPPKKK